MQSLQTSKAGNFLNFIIFSAETKCRPVEAATLSLGLVCAEKMQRRLVSAAARAASAAGHHIARRAGVAATGSHPSSMVGSSGLLVEFRRSSSTTAPESTSPQEDPSFAASANVVRTYPAVTEEKPVEVRQPL